MHKSRDTETRKVCITKMLAFFIFVFFNFSFPLFGAGTDGCMPTSCGKDGPMIQFPFRIEHLQPEYCGYPGFDVYCDEKKETVLVLPPSLNVKVKEINYTTQQFRLYDPAGCLAIELLRLNLSASPFSFSSDDSYDYLLFNYSVSERQLGYNIPCFNDSRYQFYAIYDGAGLDRYSLTSCTCSGHISSVPGDMFDANDLYLNWSYKECARCEAQGRICSLNNSTKGYQIQCIDEQKINKGTDAIPSNKAAPKALIAGATIVSFLVLMLVAALCKSIITDKENQKKIEKFLEDYRALKPTRFCYSDIKRITNNFSEKLGEGGYGVVYKGNLSNEINVAVKVLNNSKENGEEFVNEVSTIGRIHHVNVVRLLGFCAEGCERVLIYEYLPNDSLEKFIFMADSKRSSLGWQKLQDIAVGIAKGIEYLHQGCDQQILHFDIKPHNILLDKNFNPKICDFGLAKLCSKEQSAITMTAARGTMGYIAPELLSRTFGKASYKSDVYSFGMLLLEMVGGRKNLDLKVNNSHVYFPQWIYNHLNLGDDFWAQIEEGDHGNIARKLTIVGLQCIQWHPSDRPSMKVVVQMLEGDGADFTMPPNPLSVPNATNLLAEIPVKRVPGKPKIQIAHLIKTGICPGLSHSICTHSRW